MKPKNQINSQMHNRNPCFKRFINFLKTGKNFQQSFVSGLGGGKWLVLEMKAAKDEIIISSVFDEALITSILKYLNQKLKLTADISCLENKKIMADSLKNNFKINKSSGQEPYFKITTIKPVDTKQMCRALNFISKLKFWNRKLKISSVDKTIKVNDREITIGKDNGSFNAIKAVLGIEPKGELVIYAEILPLISWKSRKKGNIIVLKNGKKIKSIPF